MAALVAEEDEVEKQVEKQEDKHEGKHEDAVETAEKETAAVEQELEAQLEEDGAGGDDAGEKEPEAVTANTTSRRGRALAADDKETDAPSSSTVEAASAASEMPADCDGSTEDEEDAAAFESWTAAKLKAECRRRKLAVWGSKAKLCARLHAAPEPAAVVEGATEQRQEPAAEPAAAEAPCTWMRLLNDEPAGEGSGAPAYELKVRPLSRVVALRSVAIPIATC